MYTLGLTVNGGASFWGWGLDQVLFFCTGGVYALWEVARLGGWGLEHALFCFAAGVLILSAFESFGDWEGRGEKRDQRRRGRTGIGMKEEAKFWG